MISQPENINLIICTDNNYGFSKNGKIPWNITEDYLYFQDITTKCCIGKPNVVIMGRNTWLTIPEKNRPLSKRINIVISTTLTQKDVDTDVYIANSLENALSICETLNYSDIFICGGYQLYKTTLEKYKLKYIYHNIIDHNYKCDLILKELNNVNYNLVFFREFKLFDNLLSSEFLVEFNVFSKNEYDSYSLDNSERKYLNLLENLVLKKTTRMTRNGETISTFGKKLTFDLQCSFPLFTTKNISLYNVFKELSMFLKGSTNANQLSNDNVKIWDLNTSSEFLQKNGLNYDKGDMGPMYGFQWRYFNAEYNGCNKDYTGSGFDQIAYCINLIKNDPNSRRILMTTFNPLQASQGCLFPCHGIHVQFYVSPFDTYSTLSLLMTQRSADTFLGVPYNIVSYSLLVYMICHVINNDSSYRGPVLKPGKLKTVFCDTHIYPIHCSKAIRQILRPNTSFPTLKFNRNVHKLEDFKFEDLVLENYTPFPNIVAKMVE